MGSEPGSRISTTACTRASAAMPRRASSAESWPATASRTIAGMSGFLSIASTLPGRLGPVPAAAVFRRAWDAEGLPSVAAIMATPLSPSLRHTVIARLPCPGGPRRPAGREQEADLIRRFPGWRAARSARPVPVADGLAVWPRGSRRRAAKQAGDRLQRGPQGAEGRQRRMEIVPEDPLPALRRHDARRAAGGGAGGHGDVFAPAIRPANPALFSRLRIVVGLEEQADAGCQGRPAVQFGDVPLAECVRRLRATEQDHGGGHAGALRGGQAGVGSIAAANWPHRRKEAAAPALRRVPSLGRNQPRRCDRGDTAGAEAAASRPVDARLSLDDHTPRAGGSDRQIIPLAELS